MRIRARARATDGVIAGTALIAATVAVVADGLVIRIAFGLLAYVAAGAILGGLFARGGHNQKRALLITTDARVVTEDVLGPIATGVIPLTHGWDRVEPTIPLHSIARRIAEGAVDVVVVGPDVERSRVAEIVDMVRTTPHPGPIHVFYAGAGAPATDEVVGVGSGLASLDVVGSSGTPSP